MIGPVELRRLQPLIAVAGYLDYTVSRTGVRSEVNVVIGEGAIGVTPREYQSELLTA